MWGKPDVVSMLNPAAFGSGTFNEVKAQNYLPRPGISGAAWETTMKAPRREFEEESDLHEGTSSRKVVFWPRARGAAGWRVGRRLACSLSVCAWQVSLYSARTSCSIRQRCAEPHHPAFQWEDTEVAAQNSTVCTTGYPDAAVFRENCAGNTHRTDHPRRLEGFKKWNLNAVQKQRVEDRPRSSLLTVTGLLQMVMLVLAVPLVPLRAAVAMQQMGLYNTTRNYTVFALPTARDLRIFQST